MQSYYKKYIFLNHFHVYFQCFAKRRISFFTLFRKFNLKKHAPKNFKQKYVLKTLQIAKTNNEIYNYSCFLNIYICYIPDQNFQTDR